MADVSISMLNSVVEMILKEEKYNGEEFGIWRT